MNDSEFQRRFLYGLVRDCYEVQDNNIDFLAFSVPLAGRIKRRLEDKLLVLAKKAGFVRRHFLTEQSLRRLDYFLCKMDRLERFYNLLEDDYSRQLLIYLLRFRVLGAEHVRLPTNNKFYWDKYISGHKKFLKEKHTIKTWKNWYLNRYELQGVSGPIVLHTHPLLILNSFLLQQYSYRKGPKIIGIQPGDTIIDCGSGWGDTALYFADRTGPHGKVLTFEFLPDNLKILQRNISLNQHLVDRTEVVPNALWDKSGETLTYQPNGPNTSLLDDKRQGTLQVSTTTIDDSVRGKRIVKVDYIKMDIEGSELKALYGAEQTIRTFRPTLAISLYHRDEDFVEIPDYLDRLGLGYEFFLDHFSIHQGETILFAQSSR